MCFGAADRPGITLSNVIPKSRPIWKPSPVRNFKIDYLNQRPLSQLKLAIFTCIDIVADLATSTAPRRSPSCWPS